MRFIGNKELIAPEIRSILGERGLLGRGLTLFDAFCGTGAVSDALKDSFNLVVNDILEWCVTYTKGRIVAPDCKFENLGFDPFAFMNSKDGKKKGFFYKHYSPGGSDRMYFSAENAGRIDFIRQKIQEWVELGSIDDGEEAFLLASLIESVSTVANTAGVYGAFLKHWDPRAQKDMKYAPVQHERNRSQGLKTLNGRVEDLIRDVDCDVLYLDPPYTQNQYGTQYHLLETLVKNDQPQLSQITGSRPTAPMRSDWSKDLKKQIAFDNVIANTRARYIVCSYSSDGFMSKSYIESVLKRYGNPDTLACVPISFRKYTNFKSRETGDHLEYLFFVEKRPKNSIQITSPINYPGSKARMVPFLMEQSPASITKFIDAFGGAFNVGINSRADTVIYNDYNHLVTELVSAFKFSETHEFILQVRRQIKKFGLEMEHSAAYLAARSYYNSLPHTKRDPAILFAVIMYGFNQQIRFNSDYDFNNPVGQRWFNEKILERIVSFSRAVKERDVRFRSCDFTDLEDEIEPNCFVYLDPPYRLTTGAYNDGKRGFEGWGVAAEKRLFAFIGKLNSRSIRFMLSYVKGHKGNTNHEFNDWVAANNFRLKEYHQTQGIGRREVIVTNYD